MKTSTNKQKGRLGQQEIRDMILDMFPELLPDDVRSTPMGSQGNDLLMSPKAQKTLPINIEVKRKKKFSMSTHMKQAFNHGDLEPVLFFREDRGTWYACIDAKRLLALFKESSCLVL